MFGWCTGAFAEYARAPEDQLVTKPANLTFEQAAAVGVSASTALQLLRDDAKVQPGQKILINGASGGVGTFAVQIAKAFGAEVTGVCGTKNLDLIRSIGADVPTPDLRLCVALHGMAWHHASNRQDLAESIAELQQMANGRDDILAEAAGITAGSRHAHPAGHVGTELLVAGRLMMAGGGNWTPLDCRVLERWKAWPIRRWCAGEARLKANHL